ncbi:MAG: hypothetical protein ABEK16_00065 [Candidatus Nanohalobium sp.]
MIDGGVCELSFVDFEDIRQKVIVGGQIGSGAEELLNKRDVLYFDLKDLIEVEDW